MTRPRIWIAASVVAIVASRAVGGGYVAPVVAVEPGAQAAAMLADVPGLQLCQTEVECWAVLTLLAAAAAASMDGDRSSGGSGGGGGDGDGDDTTVVSLPAAGAVLGSALAGLVAWGRRQRRRLSAWADVHLDDMTQEERWLGRMPRNPDTIVVEVRTPAGQIETRQVVVSWIEPIDETYDHLPVPLRTLAITDGGV